LAAARSPYTIGANADQSSLIARSWAGVRVVRSAANSQTYMAWRVEAGDTTRLLSLLAAAPRFTALRRVAA
jgi:hypothetical protein